MNEVKMVPEVGLRFHLASWKGDIVLTVVDFDDDTVACTYRTPGGALRTTWLARDTFYEGARVGPEQFAVNDLHPWHYVTADPVLDELLDEEEEIARRNSAPSLRKQLLDEASDLINGDRNNQYGPPHQDFARTAALWSAWKGVDFEPHEVAVFMMLLKASRMRWSPEKADSWVDTAGYAACGHEAYVLTQEGVMPQRSSSRSLPNP